MARAPSPFSAQVVWITGASSGYGRALARAFGHAGARLLLSARRTDLLHELAASLPCARVLPLDLADTGALAAQTQEAVAVFGHVDTVVHNGAIAQNAPALQTTLAVDRHIMDVDYFSHTENTRCLLPHMLARQKGLIAVVSGILAQLTLPGRSTYAAAKAALVAYFGSLRAELIGRNIDICILIPGAMQTDLARKAVRADGRQNTPDDGDAAKRTLAYIGLKDTSWDFWKRSLADPERGIAMLLGTLRRR